MMSSPITVIETSWQNSQELLKKLRTAVAIQSNRPIAKAFDIYDNKAIHFIALDTNNTPIGTCRLLDNGRISRPQIVLEWQMKNVESGLIECAIKYAKQKTKLNELSILEDARIAPYYVHFGFKNSGMPIVEHGLPAQLMKYQIRRVSDTPSDEPKPHSTALASNDKMTTFDDTLSYLKVLLQTASQTRRNTRIYSPTLPSEIFGNKQLLTILSAHCRRSRFTQVQILVVNEKPMISGSHGLRSLYEKIPSSISIRKLVSDDDDIDGREYFIADDNVMTMRARSRTIQGELIENRSEIARQTTEFDEAWLKSRSIPDLRLTTY